MNERYVYRPLTSKHSIRVIALHPSYRHDAPISCNLREASINASDSASMAYEALSYVWGAPSGTIPIICNGKTLFITENCEMAIRRIRKKRCKRHLFIDALSINQEDDNERSTQVNIMGDVFRNATRVLVWLGQAPTPPNWRTIRMWAIFEDRTKNWLYQKWRNRVDDYLSGLIRRPSMLPHTEALSSAEWLQRVWTFQEFALARRLVFYYGRASFDLEVRFIDPSYWSWLGSMQFESASQRFDANNRRSTRCVSRVRLKTDFGDSFLPRGMNNTYMLLEYTSLMKAADPKDQVFGIYGMMRRMGAKPPAPDYSKTVEQVYVEVTIKAIEDTRTLNPICASQPCRSSVFSLPTWTPDWSNPSSFDFRSSSSQVVFSVHTSAAPACFSRFSIALRRRRSRDELNAKRRWSDLAIKLHGMRVDQISYTSDPLENGKLEPHKMAVLAHLVLGRAGTNLPEDKPSRLKSYLSFFLFLCKWNSLFWRSSESSSRSSLESFEGKHEEVTQYFRWLRRIGIDVSLDELAGSPFLSEAEDEVLEALRGDISKVSSDFPSDFCRTYDLTYSKPFVLPSGYVGLAHPGTREGDIIVIVAGSTCPLVLRPDGDYYTWMGPALVSGIMHGELWTDDETNHAVFEVN